VLRGAVVRKHGTGVAEKHRGERVAKNQSEGSPQPWRLNIPIQKWLEPFSWDAVVANNTAICKIKSTLHPGRAEGYRAARQHWQCHWERELTLKQALDVC